MISKEMQEEIQNGSKELLQKIGDKEVMPFTIPSGIITTSVSSVLRIAQEIPEIGIITTKSIGPEARAGAGAGARAGADDLPLFFNAMAREVAEVIIAVAGRMMLAFRAMPRKKLNGDHPEDVTGSAFLERAAMPPR